MIMTFMLNLLKENLLMNSRFFYWANISNANLDKSLHTSQVAHKAGDYPGFRSIKRLGVLILLLIWMQTLNLMFDQISNLKSSTVMCHAYSLTVLFC